ncbi:MAG: prolyl oligopeptidase family serine peptidase [Acidobacteriota bacterium]|nr:prolyl oligopeptidase family serine peptidase [Acidobacteriota bacterium]
MIDARRCGGTSLLLMALALATMCGCGAARTGSDQVAPRLEYPETRRERVVDSLFGIEVADPYRWLESADHPDVASWLEAQDDLAREALLRQPGREETRRRLAELAYVDFISPPRRRGKRQFYSRRHADREKAVHYWREGAEGQERVLLDPNAMSEDLSTSVGVVVPDESGERVAYALRENNADAATLHVMEVATGEVSGIDVIAGAKYARPRWTPDGRGFYYTALPVDPTIPIDRLPGEAEIKFHELGTDPAGDSVVYGKTSDPTRFLAVDLSEDGRWLFVYEQHGWTRTDVHVADLSTPDSGFRPLVVGLPAQFAISEHEGLFYALTNLDAPHWRVLRIDPRRPDRSEWEEVVAEDPAATISDGDGLNVFGGHLVVSYLKNAASEVRVYTTEGREVRTFDLPGLGTVSSLTGRAEDDDAYFAYSSFTTPARVYRTSIADGSMEQWSAIELPLDESALTTRQVRYTSRDGTEVTMFLVHATDVVPTGKIPTLLYGYGGFNVALTPRFSPWIVPWVEGGGVYAVANLRGGSEYGEEWHRAGMLTRKQNVFDDFIAAAEWLIDSGYTNAGRLATYGRSNGGLLVGAQMTQRPDLARAVVCGVPLLDMVRYHLFGSGRTWISEYGSSEDEEQFRALHAYSPYHNVEQGADYPALLMLTTDSDDRVDPLHARKFVAAVQAARSSSRPVLLRVEKNAGHGGADLVGRSIDQWTDIYAFLDWQLGAR